MDHGGGVLRLVLNVDDEIRLDIFGIFPRDYSHTLLLALRHAWRRYNAGRPSCGATASSSCKLSATWRAYLHPPPPSPVERARDLCKYRLSLPTLKPESLRTRNVLHAIRMPARASPAAFERDVVRDSGARADTRAVASAAQTPCPPTRRMHRYVPATLARLSLPNRGARPSPSSCHRGCAWPRTHDVARHAYLPPTPTHRYRALRALDPAMRKSSAARGSVQVCMGGCGRVDAPRVGCGCDCAARGSSFSKRVRRPRALAASAARAGTGPESEPDCRRRCARPEKRSVRTELSGVREGAERRDSGMLARRTAVSHASSSGAAQRVRRRRPLSASAA
ncbi:hypothetical protein C8R45DRAFT_1208781 [Mycena sanguinolenta]|nr:hypothetical protein C8R45DRAFT_1208781 [Mycena sanguinolenta]